MNNIERWYRVSAIEIPASPRSIDAPTHAYVRIPPTDFVKASDYDALAQELARVQAEQTRLYHDKEKLFRYQCPLAPPSCLMCGHPKEFAIKHLDLGSVGICVDCVSARDTWRDEAVWAAKEFMKERECFFQISYMGQWEMEIAKDPDYQRAQAILKEAGDE